MLVVLLALGEVSLLTWRLSSAPPAGRSLLGA